MKKMKLKSGKKNWNKRLKIIKKNNSNKKYNVWFSTIWKIRHFGDTIYTGEISMDEAEMD